MLIIRWHFSNVVSTFVGTSVASSILYWYDDAWPMGWLITSLSIARDLHKNTRTSKHEVCKIHPQIAVAQPRRHSIYKRKQTTQNDRLLLCNRKDFETKNAKVKVVRAHLLLPNSTVITVAKQKYTESPRENALFIVPLPARHVVGSLQPLTFCSFDVHPAQIDCSNSYNHYYQQCAETPPQLFQLSDLEFLQHLTALHEQGSHNCLLEIP